jgi:curli biogenesis system outer membrane secretion channel CsgG
MRKVLGIIVLTLTVTSGGWAQAKKRVAVMDFDMSAVQSSANQIFGGGNTQDVGKGVADMMVTKLVKDGVYSVIERQALAKIIGEQNFSNSDRANPDSAAKIGRILGVDAILIGSITQFGRDDQSHSVGGSALGGISGRYGLGGVGTHKAKAVVVISARMVDTNTGEILAAADGKGQSTRSGTSLLGGGGSSAGGGGGNYSMGSANFDDTILGEATNIAVGDVTKQLEDAAGKIPTAVINVNGLVADVTNNTLIMNVGSRAGVKVGDRLGVFHKGKEVRDPATGKVLKTINTQLGDVTITEVDADSSTGTFTGPTPPQVGDVVQTVQ